MRIYVDTYHFMMQVCLLSSDGERFEVNENVATMSVTIRDMIEGELDAAMVWVHPRLIYTISMLLCMIRI